MQAVVEVLTEHNKIQYNKTLNEKSKHTQDPYRNNITTREKRREKKNHRRKERKNMRGGKTQTKTNKNGVKRNMHGHK